MTNQIILDNIAKKLELRCPNKEAVQKFLNHYYNSENNPEKLSEYILSVATGVGKTYIIAAILNYLAEAEKITNFLIVAPGKIIREKTINNFSLNKPNSLADKLTIKPPHIIDIKNFHTAKTTDKNQVKLFIFTVQSLTQARGKTARKTSNYDELLGQSLREHLSKLDDLVILSDEHHLYYGERFSEAIRELKPKILIGLTGTPHEKTPPKEIIFRYPLARALKDELIKKPVIVGRKDSYDNEKTKLEDALLRLKSKQEQLKLYTKIYKLEPRKALMLIIAHDIQHAEETETLLKSECNLTETEIIRIDSSNINETLAQELQTIDDFNNPKKIIIAVGMLKEGWDVKNVYVLVPLRAFASQIFTEQIIGRGLRLPFGKWVEDNFKELNRLEIITHDRFQELLKQRETLTKKLFGSDTVEEEIEMFDPQSKAKPKPVFVSQNSRKNFTLQLLKPSFKFKPPENFSLKHLLTDEKNRELLKNFHQKFSSWDNIENLFQRQEFTITELNKIEAKELEEELTASQQKGELTEIRNKLTKSIIGNFCVQPTLSELEAAEQICQLVVKENNLEIVASNLRLVAYQLNKIIQDFAKTKLDKDTEKSIWKSEGYQMYPKVFADNHGTFKEISSDYNEKFTEKTKQTGYEFQKSLYTYDSFQSGIELKFAVLIDKSKKIKKWIRLLITDNIYLNYWYNGYRRYYPDFIVIDNNEIHYLVETKSEEDRDNEVVRRKAEAANKWIEKLNSKQTKKWTYWFITEEDIDKSGGDWDNLLKIL